MASACSNSNPSVNVLFVCIGNSCRSPMAEAILRHKLVEQGMTGVTVDSAGLAHWNVGRGPEPRCLGVLREHELDSEHVGRQIRLQDFYDFDYIFGMDYLNMRDLTDMVPRDAKADVRILSEFDPEKEGVIEDPYFVNYDAVELSSFPGFVGNICRSPMAEEIFRHKAKLEGDWGIKLTVDSAAIGPWHVGKGPDRRCVSVLKENGIMTKHKARQIKAKDFTTFDYIFGMDNENMSDLAEETPDGSTAVVKLLSDFDSEREGIIRDPYYDPDDKGFRHIFGQISRCLDGFITHVKKTHVK